MGQRSSANDIDEMAFAWIGRLDREGEDPALLSALEAWLEEDPRHRGAYLRAEAVWMTLDRAATAPAWMVAPAHPAPPIFGRRRLIAGAIGTALAAGMGAAWILTRPQSIDTAIGEIRHLPLPDGSVADLNTASRLQVAMGSALRTVRLNQGEVWFHVQSDAARPFVVESGKVRVRAVGTAFSVRRLERGSEVLVSDGVVEIWVEGARASTLRLAAGQKALAGEDGAVKGADAAPTEIDRKLAWRSRKIDLAGETLAEAVAEFNRYNQKNMEVQPSLAEKRFYGVFGVDDPEGFARAIHVSLKVPVSIDAKTIFIGKSDN